MNIRRLVPLAAVSLATSLIAGCSNSPGDEDGESRLSIAKIMGQDTEYSEDQWKEQEAQIQDLVAACMREEGWEYIPVEYPVVSFEVSEEDELERLQREGYGISYWTLNQGNEVLPENDPYSDWVDPNMAIVEAMSEDEMTAYNESLWGTQEEQEEDMIIEVDPETGEEIYYSTGYGAGCYGEAQEEIYGSDPMQSQDYWDAMTVFYDDLYTRIEADPRIRALNDTWSECMADAGYDLETPADTWETLVSGFQTRHDEIVGDLYSRDPFEGWTETEVTAFWESATQDEIDAMYDGLYDLTDEQRTALEALLAEEIEVAVAEYSCSKPYQEEYTNLAAEIEEAYALEHQSELEELALSLGATE